MLAIAVIAAVAAVGTFLSWAIRNGYLTLTPEARVVVSLIAALGLGAWGIRIRRNARSFGSSMIGLALVIVLVCAYAAGPGLHLVPTFVAFAGSTAVSWGLALFSHAENDEPLWCVAFGGAAIAPFVTSDGDGSFYALTGYGAFLLFAACFAVGHRTWTVAWRIFYFTTGLYSVIVAHLSETHGLPGLVTAFAFPCVLAVVAVIPFAPASHKRGALRWLAVLVVAASFATPRNTQTLHDAARVVATILGAAVLWLFLVDRLGETKQSSALPWNRDDLMALDWLDAAVIPLTLCFQAAAALQPYTSPLTVDVIAALLFLSFAARRKLSSARDAAAAACAIMTFVALAQLKLEEPTGRVLALLGVAVLMLLLHRALPSFSWVVASGLAVITPAAFSLLALVGRPPYVDPPFMTEASRTMLVMLVFLVLLARFSGWIPGIARPLAEAGSRKPDDNDEFLPDLVRTVPWAWAFLWVLLELFKAYSPSTSTLLLVIYFAVTAIAAVAVGHLRKSPTIRQVGLGLALAAAAMSVHGAATYFDVGARVIAYLVTSVFLLAIAYWYRSRGTAPAT